MLETQALRNKIIIHPYGFLCLVKYNNTNLYTRKATS